MKMMSVPVFALLLTAATVVEPCDCAPKRSVSDELAAADAVFVGTFSAALLGTPSKDDGGWGTHALLFEVRAGYKNVKTETLELMSRTRSTCAFDFHEGETYLIYAFKTLRGELHTHACSRTAHIDDAGDDIAALGEPRYRREQEHRK